MYFNLIGWIHRGVISNKRMHEHEHEHAIGGEYMSLRSFELRHAVMYKYNTYTLYSVHIQVWYWYVCIVHIIHVHTYIRSTYVDGTALTITPSFELLYISRHSNYCTRIIVTVTQFPRPSIYVYIQLCSDTPNPPLKKPIYLCIIDLQSSIGLFEPTDFFFLSFSFSGCQ